MPRLILHGAGGRLGRQILARALEDPDWRVVAAWLRPGDPRCGEDVGRLVGRDPVGLACASLQLPPPEAEVAIDVSVPAASVEFAEAMAQAGRALLVGTTGHDAAERARLERCAERVPVVIAPNLSVGAALLGVLAEHVARALGREADVEIIEAHHRRKRDAPSGTALALADRVARARGDRPEQVVRTEGPARREGAGARAEIAVHALRAGEIVGEHTAVFAWGAERIELVHRCGDRRVFAAGALRVARFLAQGPPPGLYRVEQALGAV